MLKKTKKSISVQQINNNPFGTRILKKMINFHFFIIIQKKGGKWNENLKQNAWFPTRQVKYKIIRLTYLLIDSIYQLQEISVCPSINWIKRFKYSVFFKSPLFSFKKSSKRFEFDLKIEKIHYFH